MERAAVQEKHQKIYFFLQHRYLLASPDVKKY